MQASGRYLFLPSPFINNDSRFLNIAALESPFWWFLYLMVGATLFKRIRSREKIDDLATWALGFMVFFVGFSALIESNVGTLLRHRSVLLIPILAIVFSRRKSETLSVGD